MPLDFGGDKPYNNRSPSSYNTSSYDYGSTYGGSNSKPKSEKHRVDTVKEFSDMDKTDKVEDKDILRERKRGYWLSNKEREDDIRHKNDFSLIIIYVMIIFSALVGLGFVTIIAVIAFTSITQGKMTETGIVGAILNFIADLMRIGLS